MIFAAIVVFVLGFGSGAVVTESVPQVEKAVDRAIGK